MIPKKIKDVSAATAEKSGVSKAEVELLMNTFYKEYVREKLSVGAGSRLYIPNLGSFDVIPKRIISVKKTIEGFIADHNEKKVIFDAEGTVNESWYRRDAKLSKTLENIIALEEEEDYKNKKREEYLGRIANT